MITRIEIAVTVFDTRADVVLQKLKKSGFKVVKVIINDIYTIDKELSQGSIKKIAEILTHPIVAKESFTKPLSPPKFDWAIEVGFLPGVTDNVASTVKEMVVDLLRVKFDISEGLYTSHVYYLIGDISKAEAEKIAHSFYNPVIQRVLVKSRAIFIRDRGMGKIVPKVSLGKTPRVSQVNLNVTDDELIRLGKEGIPNRDGSRRGPLALDINNLKTIRDYFRKLRRNPTDIELESLAQTWSEHCKHTIFSNPIDQLRDGLYDTYIKAATKKIRKKLGKDDFCVSVFKDNSGAIEFDDNYLITHKVETHNSPSALDPFGGSITGIVGVNRDAIGFGLGAKPIANTYGFCFAPSEDDAPIYKGVKFSQPMLPPQRIMDGVVAGVNTGGNCSGIPTPQGFLYFDPRYKGKPLVFVGTVGLIPKIRGNKRVYLKKAKPGDLIVMVGGRVGIDGIHGATFSSEAMDTGSPATAVQIGDPITQKKLSDALVKEARDLGLYTSITDNGAGGLSCSVAEMAREANGFIVDLDKVPLKYHGLAPWQIWISESQERMTLAVPKNKWPTFSNLMEQRGVEATVIGEFTHNAFAKVRYKHKTIMNISMEFLHEGLSPVPMTTTFTHYQFPDPRLPSAGSMTIYIKKMLGRLNIASFEHISRQYDHEVQGTSVLKPLQGKGRINTDTTVIRPLLTSSRGIALSHGLYPAYSDIDTYHMAASCIDTAVRNCVAVGANPAHVALLDNFCWCSSTDPERLGQLKRATLACYELATNYETPFISGKDSMFNDFKGYDFKGNQVKISIPPTLLVSSIAVIDDVTQVVSPEVKFPGDLIYVIGETFDDLGASEYFYLLGKDDLVHIGNSVPRVDGAKNKKVYRALHQVILKGFVASAQSVGRGGLAVALSKIAIGGMWGIEVGLKKLPGIVSRDDFTLFSESQGRIVVTIDPKHKKQFETLMNHISIGFLGKVTTASEIKITNRKGEQIVNLSLKEAAEAYKGTFKNM